MGYRGQALSVLQDVELDHGFKYGPSGSTIRSRPLEDQPLFDGLSVPFARQTESPHFRACALPY
jgi:hypothetical protein